jgi:BirA family biotin operon repressor/biotin-[acetyl-CoA-carboxylase] ligase
MWPAFTMQRLNIIASLATAQTIERFSRSSASIKWPNDVQLKGKKIAGILTESGIDQEILSHAVIGIGININHGKEDFQNNLQSSATSLYLASDQKIRRADVLVYLLEQFETLYNKPFHELVEPWRGRCVTIGQRLQTTLNNQSVIGTMMDIDTDGGLVLRLGSGKLVTLHSGEVTPA